MNSQIQYPMTKRWLLPFCFFICTILYIPVNAQQKPPRPITVTVSTAQHLSFGTFIQAGTDGTVIVTYTGGRSATGSVILPNMSSIVSPALFIVDSEPGVLINITIPDLHPKLFNGGNSLQMHLGDPYIDDQPDFQFITKKKDTNVYFGGTLDIKSLIINPAGAYSGTFTVTFNQQ